ncbi:MAG: Orn/Lys/Arg decarboxylase N-terminal domain-containing protein [Xanthobacter sp.]
MTHSREQNLGMRALVIHALAHEDTVEGHAVRTLVDELDIQDVDTVTVTSAEGAAHLFNSDTSFQAVVLDWDLEEDDSHTEALEVLREIRAANARIPVFLCADRSVASSIPMDAMGLVNDFIWLLEDTSRFIAGRIVAAIHTYREHVLPPMFAALTKFAQVHEYSWHTPGHTGGTAFLKHPAGRAFFEYFGENMFRSDLSISVGELGSLLDHSGPIGAGEKYAAHVFGAHRTYTVTNGSSMSNRVIMMASVTRDQLCLCDRNCHKSAEHAITLSGAIPTYMMPARNGLGIIGPIPPAHLTPDALKNSIDTNALLREGHDKTPVHAIITNSTYDGLCYNVTHVEKLLGQSVDRLHFDEAWYGYARFNPIYAGRFAMHGDPAEHDETRPSVFATQSTHKLLAALSQASFIHVRNGRRPIEHARFNEAYMMHASTSPNYAIIAANDVTAAMMDGPSGKALTTDAIREAVAFRQTMSRLNAESAARGDWFFNSWQADTVQDAESGQPVAFHDAKPEQLATDPACWVLKPGTAWHGFEGLDDDWCMLDPIKVSVVTPGMSARGEMAQTGIPASILTAYLDTKGVVVEKTTDFTILFLFSIGVTKGKWGTLLNVLSEFKRDYDANTPLDRVLPDIVAQGPKIYAGMGLKDLADSMFAAMKELKTTAVMSEAFSRLPEPELTPQQAYENLVRDNIESLTLDEMAGRVVATGVVPYPPGIPLLMPGENTGPANGPLLGYLKALEAFDVRFPGFGHDTHGVEVEDGRYRILCIRR